jgi:hypothetical protein
MCTKWIKYLSSGLLVLDNLHAVNFAVSSDSRNRTLPYQVKFLHALNTGVPEDKSLDFIKISNFEFIRNWPHHITTTL